MHKEVVSSETPRAELGTALEVSPSSADVSIINGDDFMAVMYLADSLRREGDTEGARVVLESSEPRNSEERLRLADALAKVERSDGRLDTAKKILLAALDEPCDSDAALAKIHHSLAVNYQLQGETDEALLEYAMASQYWAKAENFHDAGCTENNVALIQLSLGRLEDAHAHIRSARRYFLDAPLKSAEVDESEAQIYLAEENPSEALRLVCRAVSVFYDYNETELVRKALPTLMKAAADRQCEARK
jgi:tetratricopeptide (TPR) repeat protein